MNRHGVYPRVCGGTFRRTGLRLRTGGLSPRVRGNLISMVVRSWLNRSIPACAGEPADGQHHGGPVEVYPRVCGGTPRQSYALHIPAGLSPRVRGNLDRRNRCTIRYGSIPACAGEPYRNLAFGVLKPVYPRVCGGTYPIYPAASTMNGLSPRVRGNPSRTAGGSKTGRSIPACAGEPDC